MAKTPRTTSRIPNNCDAIPDTLDFRDMMFEPTLINVPPRVDLKEYRRHRVPVLDQGSEGACTGFALATVAHYLLRTYRKPGDTTDVSPWMFYEMAKRYDEWPGENYQGSSARGAMKAWHRHGVCALNLWPADSTSGRRPIAGARANATREQRRAIDASRRPLGAYYRVNHKNLVAIHCALREVGVLFATSCVHDGWDRVGRDGIIPYNDGMEAPQAHAFAIVAYDEEGFWIQNSWGTPWGMGGFGRISYDDWLRNGTDIWVARLGVPVVLRFAESTTENLTGTAGRSNANAFWTLRPHIVNLGNEGALRPEGTFGTTEKDIATVFATAIPDTMKKWRKKRILLYAHGGLVDENSAVRFVSAYRARMLAEEIYPLFFIWNSDYFSTLRNILEDALRRRRPEGTLDGVKSFMFDRLDDFLEPVARQFSGKAEWDEMKENAMRATERADGGARIVLRYLDELLEKMPDVEVHIVGHSAGGVLHAPIVRTLTAPRDRAPGKPMEFTGLGRTVKTATLWAPGCTIATFKRYYAPAIASGTVGRFALFTLTDRAERDDDCAGIYHKSLLYLVSNAFEGAPRIPTVREDGVPLLGMEKFIRKDAGMMKLFNSGAADWVLAPNTEEMGSISASKAQTHGAFEADAPTLAATLRRILDA